LVSMLISEDLPTLDRPIKANSGLSGLGQAATSTLLIKYFADFISIVLFVLYFCVAHVAVPFIYMKHNSIVPDTSSKLSKKEQVADMFNNIAGKYDFLNHLFSLGIDKGWRNKAIKSIEDISPEKILDVATGTGDLAISAAKKMSHCHIVGLDIAAQMLEVGKTKINTQNLEGRIEMMVGDSESIPFADEHFDAILCAFGVRNFQDLHKGLKEMHRVTRYGGRIAILEFSHPRTFPVKQLFSVYFKYIMPVLGKIVSKHSRAYSYLPESVMAFPEGDDFCAILQSCGFKNVNATALSLGITSLYTAEK
jgi:demethylmenaquinone methyltransferase / 2-methoxy-6-polyprenyl-1,4-benzoquinol methylase